MVKPAWAPYFNAHLHTTKRSELIKTKIQPSKIWLWKQHTLYRTTVYKHVHSHTMLLKSFAVVNSLQLSRSLVSCERLELRRNLVRRLSCRTSSWNNITSSLRTHKPTCTMMSLYFGLNTFTDAKLSWDVKCSTVASSNMAKRGWLREGGANFSIGSGQGGDSSIIKSKSSIVPSYTLCKDNNIHMQY